MTSHYQSDIFSAVAAETKVELPSDEQYPDIPY
jgi:hypothetical protein